MTLGFEIKFYDYWHLSSGLSAGARLDSTVVKDEDGLPYVPGKTIKGLLREMGELLESEEFVRTCYGEEGVENGVCYFSNATLEQETKRQIISNGLQDNLYDVIASTKIDDNGIAEDSSLREIEVVIPVSLHGEIKDIAQGHIEEMRRSMMMIKRMGLNRNRGLGRCEFIVKEAS